MHTYHILHITGIIYSIRVLCSKMAQYTLIRRWTKEKRNLIDCTVPLEFLL